MQFKDLLHPKLALEIIKCICLSSHDVNIKSIWKQDILWWTIGHIQFDNTRLRTTLWKESYFAWWYLIT